jgi:hypothetical protein
MATETIAGLIEIVLFYSLALGIGIWQVVKMRRQLREDAKSKQAPKTPSEPKILPQTAQDSSWPNGESR